MSKNTSIEITGKIVELLTSLESEERVRIIQASLTLLGEGAVPLPKRILGAEGQDDVSAEGYPARARAWMKQFGISVEQIQKVFHVVEGAESILVTSPGKNRKEQALNAYILTGVSKLLSTGEPTFDDAAARVFCKQSGCYDQANHALYLKGKGNEFVGTKDKWTLTNPGLERAAKLIKELDK
jgi:hypothetical protein